jgi:hypothetical protein
MPKLDTLVHGAEVQEDKSSSCEGKSKDFLIQPIEGDSFYEDCQGPDWVNSHTSIFKAIIFLSHHLKLWIQTARGKPFAS